MAAAEFDYVVVGGGSAGAVVASRLSEDPTVTVVEAGVKASHLFYHAPLALAAAFQRFAWQMQGEPEPGLGRRAGSMGGQVLGGSSSLNGMVYSRGHAEDYDLWHRSGLSGWGYADVLPHFRKLEASWRGGALYHGAGGPIGVSRIDPPIGLFERLRQSVTAAGHRAIDDPFGAAEEGIGRLEATIFHFRRTDRHDLSA